MKKGKVVRLRVYPAKGEKGTPVESLELMEGLGIKGDFHATGAANAKNSREDRQVSMLSLENRQWMENTEEEGLCFSRFKENICAEGLEIPGAGHRLMIGTALLEITGESKMCHPECPLFSNGETCRLSGQNLFAKVVGSGTLRIGDIIEVVGKETPC